MSNRAIVCFDLETTGLLADLNEITEFGAVKIIDGVICDQYSTLVKPKGKIDKFVSELTGITQSMLADAPTFSEVYQKFLSFMGDSLLVAHNVQFDIEMFNQSLMRINQPPLTNDYLDTQELATIVYPDLYSHKLGSLAKHFEFNIDPHRALNDALCVAKLFLNIEKDLRKINPLVLNQAVKLISEDKAPLKAYLFGIFSEIYQGQSLNYKDYLSPVARIRRKKASAYFNGDIKDFFSAQSNLQKEFASFEIRPSQQKMAEVIWNCFNQAEHGIIEAGTGTGKSIAYLIPAVLFAIQKNTPIIISTKTKHLQKQLDANDLPKLKNIFPDFTYCVVKGKENYLDINKFDDLHRSYSLGVNKRDPIEFIGLLSWVLKTQTGDMSELHPNLYSKFYPSMHFTSFSENPFKKKNQEKCFVNKIRKQAKEVDLVITNHSLVLADLINESGVLPSYNYLIIDEAHTLDDSATSAFAVHFNSFSLMEIQSFFLGKKQKEYFNLIFRLFSLELNLVEHKETLLNLIAQAEILKELNDYFFNKLDNLLMSFPAFGGDARQEKRQLTLDQALTCSEVWAEVEEAYGQLAAQMNSLAKAVDEILASLEQEKQANIKDFSFKLTGIKKMLQLNLEGLSFLFTYNADYIRWLEQDKFNNRKVFKLIAAPVDCAIKLAKHLFAEKRSIILTSATLTINQSFDYYLRQMGLLQAARPYQTYLLPSDFDYKNQATFYLIKDLPAFNESKEGERQMALLISQFIRIRRGRILVLFTSHKVLKSVYYLLKNYLDQENVIIYSQHLHGSRENILERFKQEPEKSVILGVDSFWEGVDLPGQALNCVIMQKLPFNVPTDPLHLARIQHAEQQGKNGFMDYMLPLAILKFKQGIGRLIRTKDDTGSIIVLDNRLTTKNYGRYFVKEVAHYNVVEARADNIQDYMQN